MQIVPGNGSPGGTFLAKIPFSACDKRKKSTKPKDAWEYLAMSNGWEAEGVEHVGASPFRAEKLLGVRASADVLCGCGHPYNWAQYNAQFMALYTEPPSEGYRLPFFKQAEEADRQVMGDVFQPLYTGSCLMMLCRQW